MDGVKPSAFLVAWHYAMIAGAITMFAGAILVMLYHALRVSMIPEYHKKYDYLYNNEIKNLKLSFFFIGIAAAMLVNRYGMDTFLEVEVWFYVRFFISIACGTLIGYVAYLILEYYYPTRLNRKLRKWRYIPRTNPKTGNKMRLLSEEEEDVHLDEGMQAEENIFSIDYDVWIDEQTGDVKIEKYPGHLQALRCNNCGFFTMKIVREEITRQPTPDQPGELVKHYGCTYCKSIRATSFNISTKDTEDYKTQQQHNFRKRTDIDAVKIEIHSTVSGTKYFEFPNAEQARQFLDEYENTAV